MVIVLTVANVIASSGFSVLAESVGNIVYNAHVNSEELKNYYYLYLEETEKYSSSYYVNSENESAENRNSIVESSEVTDGVETSVFSYVQTA